MKKLLFLLVILVIFIFTYVEAPTHLINTIVSEYKKEYPSVLNFGDVMFDRGVRNIIENRGRDPFEYIKKDLDLISGFDVTIVNLEGPIVDMDRSLCQTKDYNFQFAKYATDYLKSVGINMVNIANNHTYDCYKAGFESTKTNLNLAGIEYIGDSDIEKSYIAKTIDDKKVAFIGIDETVQMIPVSKFYPIIKELSTENDYIVVNIHWGTEYLLSANETQKAIAHKLVDSGADVIFGHHPHVVEPVEIYKGKAIFYSLGNFVFDQNFGDTTTGLGVGVEFQEKKAIFTLFPYKMRLFAPDFLEKDEKTVFCDSFLKNLTHADCSFGINTD